MGLSRGRLLTVFHCSYIPVSFGSFSMRPIHLYQYACPWFSFCESSLRLFGSALSECRRQVWSFGKALWCSWRVRAGMLTVFVKTIVNTNINTLSRGIVARASVPWRIINVLIDWLIDCRYQYQYFCDSTFHSLLHSATFIFTQL